MCEREFDYHRFKPGYIFNQSTNDKIRNIEIIYHAGVREESIRKKPLDVVINEILNKLQSYYGRNFNIINGFPSKENYIIYVECELGQLIYHFDTQYSNREWNLKMIRENGFN